jgi:hypothetical protein
VLSDLNARPHGPMRQNFSRKNTMHEKGKKRARSFFEQREKSSRPVSYFK